MKLILENILLFLKRPAGLLLLLFFGKNISAQDTAVATVIPDTTLTEQVDTSSMHTEYFDKKTSNVIDTVQMREVPGYIIDSFKKDDAFWYANRAFKRKKTKEQRDLKLPSQWMNMPTFLLIVILFIGLLMWYLFQNNIIRRRQKIASESADVAANENIFEINYQREIERAINTSNYRLAIRLMFLRLLRDLSRKNIIQYKHEKTNLDYLSQLSSGEYYGDFFRLARDYEYVWYGKFEVSSEAFKIIKNDFEKFDRKLS
ncbi:MAG TPA: hypothetical protein VGG71_06850 [Chitinophagaceae bacterium]|jgi:hypothetical protein